MSFLGWSEVARLLDVRAAASGNRLNEGQRAELSAIGERLNGGHGNACRGVVVADEVGMGKTRVASGVAAAVVKAGGRVAILVPPGLGFQWQHELRGDELYPPDLVRSLTGYLAGFGDERPWMEERVLLVSHQVANWRLGEASAIWRWGLLPELVARQRKRAGKWPRGYHRWKPSDEVREAATAIHAHLIETDWQEALDELDQLSGLWSNLLKPSGYGSCGEHRPALERAFGWGLGRFHLVIIDEAHKARGNSSGLSRLLDQIIHVIPEAARLALTATPVALDVSEWAGTLERVGVPEEVQSRLMEASSRYHAATTRLRDTWRTSETARAEWTAAAASFAGELRPYVLRRDKREEDAVRQFNERAGGQVSYRKLVPEAVQVSQLTPAWKRVVFASEAISATVHGGEDPVGKRLRLTLGNGHGVASQIDAALASDKELTEAEIEAPIEAPSLSKRDRRTRFWVDLIRRQATSSGSKHSADLALCEHPQIVRAVELVEERLKADEKVLVFGRFSRPMRVLHDILNARARLRALSDADGEPWPEEHIVLGEIDQLAARQLGLDLAKIDAHVAAHPTRYRRYEERRRWLRKNLVRLIERGLGALDEPTRRRPRAVLAALLEDAVAESDKTISWLGRGVWALASSAVRSDVLSERESPEMVSGLTTAFLDLLEVAGSDPDADDEDVGELSVQLREVVQDEFSRQRGGLARLLVGSTPHRTRRLLQAAFNRAHSFPRVLVAQSVVGREGLNLHEACRVVLLLHPEWNPGVVEQQIGRVDRIGSRWQQMLEEAVKARAPVASLPRIDVVMPVFEGTYDEHHWRVLQRRWDDLRAQLHGVVVPPSVVGEDPEEQAIAREINASAPDFSPGRWHSR